MAVAFKKLFNMKFDHKFFVNGISRDVMAVPTSATAKILKGNNLLFRRDEQGFRIMYRTDGVSDVPFVAFANLELRFALVLVNNVEFPNYTDLDKGGQVFAGKNNVWFTNQVVTTSALTYEITDELMPVQFTYVFPNTQTSGTGTIKIFNESGTEVTPANPDPDNIQPGADGKYRYPVDFMGLPAGRYKFTTQIAANPAVDKYIYIDNELVTENILGVVKIKVNNYLPASFPAGREYKAVFENRKTKWQYVMVLKSGIVVTSDTLNIIDRGTAVAPYIVNTFARQADTVVNGVPAAVFLSDQKIPYFKTAKKKLTLVKFIPDPPNPPIEVNVVTDISNPQLNSVSFTKNAQQEIVRSIIYVYV